jgi:hypothetical protein
VKKIAYRGSTEKIQNVEDLCGFSNLQFKCLQLKC